MNDGINDLPHSAGMRFMIFFGTVICNFFP